MGQRARTQLQVKLGKQRDPGAAALVARSGNASGRHANRDRLVMRGASRKVKHKNQRSW